jgi:hypothetical protein
MQGTWSMTNLSKSLKNCLCPEVGVKKNRFSIISDGFAKVMEQYGRIIQNKMQYRIIIPFFTNLMQ